MTAYLCAAGVVPCDPEREGEKKNGERTLDSQRYSSHSVILRIRGSLSFSKLPPPFSPLRVFFLRKQARDTFSSPSSRGATTASLFPARSRLIPGVFSQQVCTQLWRPSVLYPALQFPPPSSVGIEADPAACCAVSSYPRRHRVSPAGPSFPPAPSAPRELNRIPPAVAGGIMRGRAALVPVLRPI